MTAVKFIQAMEECYGQYKPMLKGVCLKWATEQPEDFLSHLAEVLLETVSTRYGTPPGLPEFAEAGPVADERTERSRANKYRQIAQQGQKLIGHTDGTWDEVEYRGRKMTRGAAYLEALAWGMANGIHPKDNADAQRIMEGKA